MKKEIIILTIAALFLVGFGVSLYFNFIHSSEKADLEAEVESLRAARDSVSNYNIAKAHKESLNHLHRADSLQGYIKNYHRADSINSYKNRYAKSKIPSLNPIAADRLRDSIRTARGYHGPR